MAFNHANGRPVNFSTAPSSQRELNATPSSVERTRSARLVDSDWFIHAARTVWSSTGVRSPFSHGVKMTPWLPAGAVAASSSNRW